MRNPSRNMPELSTLHCGTPAGIAIAALLLVMIGAPVALLTWAWWPFGLLLAGCFAMHWIDSAARTRRIAAARAGDSICTFARTFERRTIDPWILRATYEELATSCGFPIRRGDRFEDHLGIECPDIELFAEQRDQELQAAFRITPEPPRRWRAPAVARQLGPHLVDTRHLLFALLELADGQGSGRGG